MKIMNLAMCAALASSLFAGCAMDDATGEDGAGAIPSDEEIAERDGRFDDAIDARGVLGAQGVLVNEDVAPVALQSFYSGTIAPGGTQSWVWNNASATASYAVGLSPIGASSSSPCVFEVVRTWDVRTTAGEREFRWQIKNIGTIACATNILLEGQTSSGSFSTGGIEAGASKSFTWNNLGATSTYFVSVSPSGQTSANACQLELTRLWYAKQTDGERELKFTIKNIGAIACQGDIQLAHTTSAVSSHAGTVLAPGEEHTSRWNNANPLTRIYSVGINPNVSSGGACQIEITRTWYRQVINTTGTAEREFFYTYKNIGSVTCGGTVLLNYVPAA